MLTIREWNNLTTDKEVSGVWREENASSHSIPLDQSLTESKTLTLLTSVRAERGEEASEAKCEASGDGLRRFRKKGHLHNAEVQGEAAASYPDDLAEIVDEGDCAGQIFNVDETAFYRKKMPCRLS